MKKTLYALLFSLIYLPPTFAHSLYPNPNNYTLSLTAGSTHYQEPDQHNTALSIDGQQYGLGFAYTRLQTQNWLLHLSQDISIGPVNYQGDEGQGTITDAQNQVYETRLWSGYRFSLNNSAQFIPYAGFGYRNLHNNLQDGSINNVIDAHFPLRVIQYFYSPIGSYFTFDTWHHTLTSLQLEYDYFWHGVVTTHSFNIPGAGTIPEVTNEQSQGYGLRTSLLINIPMHHSWLSFGPYLHYWNIAKSNTVSTDDGDFIEPRNNTIEVGAELGVTF